MANNRKPRLLKKPQALLVLALVRGTRLVKVPAVLVTVLGLVMVGEAQATVEGVVVETSTQADSSRVNGRPASIVRSRSE